MSLWMNDGAYEVPSCQTLTEVVYIRPKKHHGDTAFSCKASCGRVKREIKVGGLTFAVRRIQKRH